MRTIKVMLRDLRRALISFIWFVVEVIALFGPAIAGSHHSIWWLMYYPVTIIPILLWIWWDDANDRAWIALKEEQQQSKDDQHG